MGSTDFPKLYEPSKNSRCQHIKFGCPGFIHRTACGKQINTHIQTQYSTVFCLIIYSISIIVFTIKWNIYKFHATLKSWWQFKMCMLYSWVFIITFLQVPSHQPVFPVWELHLHSTLTHLQHQGVKSLISTLSCHPLQCQHLLYNHSLFNSSSSSSSSSNSRQGRRCAGIQTRNILYLHGHQLMFSRKQLLWLNCCSNVVARYVYHHQCGYGYWSVLSIGFMCPL